MTDRSVEHTRGFETGTDGPAPGALAPGALDSALLGGPPQQKTVNTCVLSIESLRGYGGPRQSR